MRVDTQQKSLTSLSCLNTLSVLLIDTNKAPQCIMSSCFEGKRTMPLETERLCKLILPYLKLVRETS